MRSQTKDCPDCAEEVRAGDRYCTYCGHEFEVVLDSAAGAKIEPEGPKVTGHPHGLLRKGSRVSQSSLVLVLVVVLAFGLGVWWFFLRTTYENYGSVAEIRQEIANIEDFSSGEPVGCSGLTSIPLSSLPGLEAHGAKEAAHCQVGLFFGPVIIVTFEEQLGAEGYSDDVFDDAWVGSLPESDHLGFYVVEGNNWVAMTRSNPLAYDIRDELGGRSVHICPEQYCP